MQRNKRIIKSLLFSIVSITMLLAFTGIVRAAPDVVGRCGTNCGWSVTGDTITYTKYKFDGLSPKTGEITFTGLSEAEKAAVKNVTKAVIKYPVISVGESTTQGLSKLETVAIESSSCKSIDKQAFYNLPSLKSVTLNTGLETIGEEAFRLCTSLKTISIPDTVKTISMGAFWSSGLQDIKLSSNLTSLGEFTFKACRSLKKITIPDQLQTIEGSCFTSCERLETADLGSGIKEIKAAGFAFCEELKEIRIPSCTTVIGNSAFKDCKKLCSLDLSHVTTIGQIAVAGCTGLETIKLSDELKSVQNHSFLNNYTEKKVIFDGTPEDFARIASKDSDMNTDLLTGTVTYLKSSSTLPKLEDTEKKILSFTGKEEVPGAVFNTLCARVVKSNKKKIQLKWKAVTGASGYLIYGGGRKGSYKKLTDIKNGSTVTYTQTGLKANRYYKYSVVAYQNVGIGIEDLRVLSVSPTFLAATLGGKYRNTSSVKGPKKLALKKGKKQKLQVSVLSKASQGKSYKNFLKMRYESTDPTIATVTGKGRVKAVSKGTCYIFAYAQDGKFRKIKVQVKNK